MVMDDSLDDALVDFACPDCGYEAQEKFGRFKNDGKFTCSGCGVEYGLSDKEFFGAKFDIYRSLGKQGYSLK